MPSRRTAIIGGALLAAGGAVAASRLRQSAFERRVATVGDDPLPDDRGVVLTRGHGFQVDHIGLAVPDTQEGVRYVEDKTGVAPVLTARDPGEFYWSGALGIGADSFLEIIGPNPDHRGVQPFKSVLAGLREPVLMFWYVATDDFNAFAKRVKDAGARLDQIVDVDPGDNVNGADYTRAIIGPGFVSQRPSVIEWRNRSVEQTAESSCTLTAFSMSLPDPSEINALFRTLGINVAVGDGPSRMAMTLDTPKGDVEFTNNGYELTTTRMLAAIARRPFG
ncbi:MAG: VOC family protein [Pseudomonadota bacterium]